MIERYTLPEMGNIWSLNARYQTWLAVEIAVLQAMEEQGQVPAGVAASVRTHARFDIARIEALEAELKHDVIAFLTNVGESIGENSRFVHLGMTSSDLIDTALSLQIRQAGDLLLEKLERLRKTLLQRAFEEKDTPMIGRSHGIHGEPITFGLKLLVWVDELERHDRRLRNALEENRLGKFSGAMGTYANISPDIERRACALLDLKPARTATQVIQRDIHAQFILTLASLAASLEKFATELRHLQRTEVLEVEEAFTPGQKGSSAMPHKRNPVSGENITGLARMVRSYAVPMLENVALWHERDISHSSVERVVFPDACILADYMLWRTTRLVDGLNVYRENMRKNLDLYGGVVYSQRVLLALVEKGLSREEAYRLVQRNAHAVWNHPDGNLRETLRQDAEVTTHLTPEEIERCFDIHYYLKHVDTLFNRFGATV